MRRADLQVCRIARPEGPAYDAQES